MFGLFPPGGWASSFRGPPYRHAPVLYGAETPAKIFLSFATILEESRQLFDELSKRCFPRWAFAALNASFQRNMDGK